jgi:hypothetical protein
MNGVNIVNKSPIKHQSKKPLLILDLDGTLIGTGMPPLPRPGLIKFLKYAFRHFEVALWTAGDESWLQYALDSVLGDFLSSIEQEFLFMIYRIGEHNQHTRTKPLTYVWSRMSNFNVNNTLIVDNTPTTYSLNPNNGIFIPTFSDNIHDIMLKLLQKHLVECMNYYGTYSKFPDMNGDFEPPLEEKKENKEDRYYSPEHVSHDAFQTSNKDTNNKRRRSRRSRKSHRTTKKIHV